MRYLEGLSQIDHGSSILHHPTASSFIRRCWFPERGCDESSTCDDLRKLWEGGREDVKKLPPPAECGRPTYIVTGASKASRNGVMDEDRLDTLIFPGERWHKCCIIPGPTETSKPKFLCEHLKTLPRQKLMREMKGWCGPHKCVNPRDRCLIVDEEIDEAYKAKHKGECPFACKEKCIKTQQKFECIYMGDEPPFGEEGSETPKKMFNENEQYDVFGLASAAPEVALPHETAEACIPLAAAFLPRLAAHSQGLDRRDLWSGFL
mmetsp:Transcript_26767/g.41636  ORF Transcript_26767/g.41636 Transcript_26767/m.41636 type:complete len:263 (-) Transcript_26767:10-798(-)